LFAPAAALIEEVSNVGLQLLLLQSVVLMLQRVVGIDSGNHVVHHLLLAKVLDVRCLLVSFFFLDLRAQVGLRRQLVHV
jgi:hypothetical protein